ncbi:uncharacterized protein IL334_007151 [Kwoniella shivajii]|uniref:LysM domain-containing protein n=1 Tax=Kwoniella shivajii TaxID=564305 RepID=A0ABZ1D985_9TREE|nr:hypothetical protein IL334_007151 [Kwoniella shivajii]
MQASTSSYTLSSSTPPQESDIWGSPSTSPSTSPRLNRSLIRRRTSSYNNTPKIPSYSSTSSSPNLNSNIEDKFPTHPLEGITPPTQYSDTLGDISRPTLKRLTTETERHVAESTGSRSGSEFTGNGSVRGSFDILRMTPGGSNSDESSREVEVLIHTIKPHESLAGIALLYGIDLATLRKSNKLWSSDPIHIRTHLYVPLEACKWNKAKESLVRGPGEGQVTLLPKRDKGKGKESDLLQNGSIFEHHDDLEIRNQSNTSFHLNGNDLINISESTNQDSSKSLRREREYSFENSFLPSTNTSYNHDHTSPPTSTEPLGTPLDSTTPRILDVVRIPSSQLRFFPKPHKPPDELIPSPSHSNANGGLLYDSQRKSIDDTLRKANRSIRHESSLGGGKEEGPTIVNDLSTLPPSLTRDKDKDLSSLSLSPSLSSSLSSSLSPSSNARAKTKSNMVKLRPPSTVGPSSTKSKPRINSSVGGVIQDTIKDFFTVPPPPNQLPFSNPSHAGSLGRSAGSSRIPSSASLPGKLSENGRPIPRASNQSNSNSPSSSRNHESMELVPRFPDLGLDLGIGGLGIGLNGGRGNTNGRGVVNRNGSVKKSDKQD